MILLFPAGLRCLSSEARGWSWLIYEPSPHPAPPVSLVFLISSSSQLKPRSQSLTPQLCPGTIWQHQATGALARALAGKGVQGVWMKPLVFFSLLYLLPEQAASHPSRTKLGCQGWP